MSETGNRGRAENLMDLGDSVRELCDTRTHSEFLEAVVVETVTTRSGRSRVRRTKQRKRHIVQLPGLLAALAEAAVPGAGEAGAAQGGFESRPSAQLEPLAVLNEVIADVSFWANTFNLNRPDLTSTVRALVSAPHDDAQLARIARQAARWVRRARLATGFDRAPFTLGASCPYCGRRNALVITGDMQAARCQRCGVDWTPDTIGLLADMLTKSAEHETLALAPCWQDDCTRYGPHDRHGDAGGRTWGDTCPVSDPNGRISA